MKNTFVKVLSFMMALMMVVGMFSVVTFAAEDEHVCAPSGEPIDVVDATCTTIGYKKYLCECGEEVIGDVVPANKAHNYQKVPAKAATCTEEGNTEGWACADCGAGIPSDLDPEKQAPQKIEKVAHQWGDYTVKVDKTCTTNAFTTRECVVCATLNKIPVGQEGGYYKETPNTMGHDYVYTVDVEVTSCTNGQVTITCSSCDYKEIAVQTEGHTPVTMVKKSELQAQIDAETDADAKKLLEEALKRGYVADSACGYTWESGKYCSECWLVLEHKDNGTQSHKSNFVTEINTDNLNTQLANMTIPGTNNKFTVGSPVRVYETCTANGWELHKCSDCGNFWIKTLLKPENGHTASDWSRWTSTETTASYPNTTTAKAIEEGETHMYVFVRTKTCTATHGGVVCGQELAKETTKKTAHNYDNSATDKTHTVEYKVTCYDNGYIHYDCNYCTEEHDEITVVAKKYHSYEAEGANPVYVKIEGYNCADATKAKLITTCTHPECDNRATADVKDPYTKTIADPNRDADHNYVLDEVKATCMVPNHYRNLCTICGATAAYTGDKVIAGANVNSSNHVAAYDIANSAIANYVNKNGQTVPSATATTLTEVQKLSCTTDEVKYFVCACGERVELTTRKATQHQYVIGGNDKDEGAVAEHHVYKDGACTPDCKHFEPVTPTCVSGGQTAGELCVVCGDVKTAPTALGVNPNNHFEGKPSANKVTVVLPNCKNTGYSVYNCTKCFVKVTEPTVNDKGETYTDANYHVNMKAVSVQNPFCVYPGLAAHYFCADCNGYFTAATAHEAGGFTTVSANKTTVEKLAEGKEGAEHHTWVKVDLQYETCTNNGWVEFKYCSVCQGGTPAADYTDVKVVTLDNGKNWTVDDDKTDKAGQNEAYNLIKKDKHGLTYTKNWASLIKYTYEEVNGQLVAHKVTATCTDGAWIAVPDAAVCVFCSALAADRAKYEKNGTLVGSALSSAEYWQVAKDHKVNNVSAYEPVQYVNYALGTLNVVDCTKISFVKYECSECEDVKMFNYRPGKAHTFPTADAEGNFADGVLKTDPASCTENGSTYVICTACTQTKEISVLSATGHYIMNGAERVKITFNCKDYDLYKNMTCAGTCGLTVTEANLIHNEVNVEVAKTCTTDGYNVTYCADCDKDYSAINEYYKANGHDFGWAKDKLVFVSENAVETVYRCNVCGQNYNVAKPAATPDSLASTTYSVEKIAAGETVDVIVKVSGKALTYNAAIVTLNFNADKFEIVKATAGDAKAITACGEKKVSIFVPNDVDGNAQTAAVAADGTVVVTVTLQAKRYANGAEKISATVLFNEGTKNADTAEATEQKKSVTIAGLGNLNGDALFTAEDAIAIHGMISEDYNATADVNGDGVVNMADAIAVAKYAASNKKASDFLKMIGEYDKIEEIVFAMYEDGKLADMDGDRVILINDAYALINKIEEKINAADSFSYNSVEELIYAVMTAKA